MHNPDVPAVSLNGHAPYYLLRTALIAAVLVTAAITLIVFAGRVPFFQENGPIEMAQLKLWIGAALFALILAIAQPRTSDKAALALVGLAATAAAAREIDAHILLNPETIGDLGVRYRIDWWLDGGVSPLRKAAWAGVALLALGFVVASTRAAHFHPILAFKRRSRTIFYFGACVAFLGIGFAFDDLLRGVIPLATAQTIEESAEVVAPVFYLAGANHLAVAGLVGRRAALHERATDTLAECKPTSSPSPSSTSTASASASPNSTTSTRPASATASPPSSTR